MLGTQSPITNARPAKSSSAWQLGILFASYAAALLVAGLVIPLRIPEITQLAASRNFSIPRFCGFISQAPQSDPLNYLIQLPFVLLLGHSRLSARLVSVAFALGSCWLFVRLAKRIPLERTRLALLLFMLLPVHFALATEALPHEQALFFLLLATLCYFRLLAKPDVQQSVHYGVCLTLAIYSDHYAVLPALGYVLFLFRFADRKQERRALWKALPATCLPILLFLPYSLWAHSQPNSLWLAALSNAGPVSLHALRNLSPERILIGGVAISLIAGVLAGAWSSFRLSGGALARRIRLFCLFGGILSTTLLGLMIGLFLGGRMARSELLWSAPATVILVTAAIEWFARQFRQQTAVRGAAVLLLALCAVIDFQYVFRDWSRVEDVQAIASALPAELTPDSCVVFVPEKYSEALFLLYQPELGGRECLDYFHKQVVLVSHPYVSPAQQHDAESYFRGLDFVETKRRAIGAGQIVVMKQRR